MKKLSNFLTFDWQRFANEKEFVVVGTSEWVDFDTKQHLGTKINTVISSDRTNYNSNDVSNLYEKLTFKVAKDVTVSVGSRVLPVNAVATVYGEFRNMLSVKCDDIKVAPPKAASAS